MAMTTRKKIIKLTGHNLPPPQATNAILVVTANPTMEVGLALLGGPPPYFGNDCLTRHFRPVQAPHITPARWSCGPNTMRSSSIVDGDGMHPLIVAVDNNKPSD